MLAKLQSYIVLATNWKDVYQKNLKLDSKINIKNQLIAQELEQACKNQHGVLTCAEYLHIMQFGKNGFYAKNSRHGKTDIENRWATAIANYCESQNIHTIIEFGCGAGELGAATVHAYQQETNKRLSWIGIEINRQLHPQILANFRRYKQENALQAIVTTLDEIPPRQNTLFIFPYSLDNIAPQLFANTNENRSCPNTLIGIIVENGQITEKLLSPEVLEKKGIALKNGIFQQGNLQFDLSSWKLRQSQQAFIPIDAYRTLANYARLWKEKANLLIIDEFREDPWFFSLGHRGTPRSLYEKNRICYDRKRYYRETAKHNFYYPMYKTTLVKFLHEIGFRTITFDIEQKIAANLQGKPWFPLKKTYATFAITATNWKKTDKRTLSITCNWKKIM